MLYAQKSFYLTLTGILICIHIIGIVESKMI